VGRLSKALAAPPVNAVIVGSDRTVLAVGAADALVLTPIKLLAGIGMVIRLIV
jgi:hypothetical protein